MYNKVFRFVRGKLKNHRFNSIISEVYFQKVRQLCLSDSKYQDQEKILLKCKSNKALFISVDTGELYSARLRMMRAIKFLTQIYVLFGYVANSRLQTPCKKKPGFQEPKTHSISLKTYSITFHILFPCQACKIQQGNLKKHSWVTK